MCYLNKLAFPGSTLVLRALYVCVCVCVCVCMALLFGAFLHSQYIFANFFYIIFSKGCFGCVQCMHIAHVCTCSRTCAFYSLVLCVCVCVCVRETETDQTRSEEHTSE